MITQFSLPVMSTVIHKLALSFDTQFHFVSPTGPRNTDTVTVLSTGKQENKQSPNIEHISQDYVNPFTECWICVCVCVCVWERERESSHAS